MKTKLPLIAAYVAMTTFVSNDGFAQGLFVKAGEQANQALAAFESIWDSYYGKFDELLVAEAVKEDGNLEFDTEHGIAHFPVRLKINEASYAKWLEETKELLAAAGIKEGNEYPKSRKIGGTYYVFPDNANAEIEKACAAGELEMPRVGVIVELLDGSGTMIQYASLPLGVFCQNKRGPSDYNKYPLCDLGRGNDSADKSDIEKGKVDESAYASVSFAGLTRKTLLDVDDIRCRVLVDPEFTEESRRLALAKIKADDKVFAEHGIETKTILLPGGVPLAVNKTPRGLWFGRYEVTQDQWTSLMGNNPSVDRRRSTRTDDVSTVAKLFDALWRSDFQQFDSPDMPVDYVSYGEVLSFVQKLNALPVVKESGLVFALPKGRYYHSSYRREPDSSWNKGIPDWEYACLGGKAYGGEAMQEQGVLFGFDLEGNAMEWEETSWNAVRDGYDTLHAKFGQFGSISSEFVHPVGMKRPNAFGLFDMIGNAGEIVERVNATKDGIVKGLQDNDPKDLDYTRSESFYVSEDDKGWKGRGFRLSVDSEQLGKKSNLTTNSAGSIEEPRSGMVGLEGQFKSGLRRAADAAQSGGRDAGARIMDFFGKKNSD